MLRLLVARRQPLPSIPWPEQPLPLLSLLVTAVPVVLRHRELDSFQPRFSIPSAREHFPDSRLC